MDYFNRLCWYCFGTVDFRKKSYQDCWKRYCKNYSRKVCSSPIFLPPNFKLNLLKFQNFSFLRVVQTQASLFFKSMSERGGSDVERLWNGIYKSTQNQLKITPLKFRVVPCRIRLFPTLISKGKWLGSELPLRLNWPFLRGNHKNDS